MSEGGFDVGVGVGFGLGVRVDVEFDGGVGVDDDVSGGREGEGLLSLLLLSPRRWPAAIRVLSPACRFVSTWWRKRMKGLSWPGLLVWLLVWLLLELLGPLWLLRLL